LAKWKIDRTMAIYGVVFGVLAMLTGTFLLTAVEGGFIAEGFFLIVISWVLLLVLVAKVTQWVRGRSRGKDDGL
jgi:hypothetical protein